MDNRLTILYYHEIVEQGEGYSYQKIEKEKFEAQMRCLRDRGYRTLFFSELRGEIPDKAVIVSFDDGFRSVYDHGAPLMEQYGIRGNIYLPTAYIDEEPQFLTWDMVRELKDKGLFEMQAHTHRHVDVRTLDKEALREEIEASDRVFSRQLGTLPNTLCLPFGTYSRANLRHLRETGRYDYVLGSFYGSISPDRRNAAVLPRIGISNEDSMETFAAKLEGRYNWKGPLQRARLLAQNLRQKRITNYEY